jgi:hypothetical protein
MRFRCNSRPLMAIATLAALTVSAAKGMGETFPPVSQLKPHEGLPDPLVNLDGTRVTTVVQWRDARRPELKALFQHYMYGYFPSRPPTFRFEVVRRDGEYLGGTAVKKEITLRFGPSEAPPIHLLVVIPLKRSGPAPVFVGLNFCGNHALLDDPTIELPTAWMPNHCPGCRDGSATDEGRGKQPDAFAFEQAVARGYAIATCYAGDIDPDRNDFTDGVHPHFRVGERRERGAHDWGTIAAWAWGLHRCVDYLVTDDDIDAKRIAVMGHSRLGKTALLAGAFDERIALVIPHQAGCGGSAPSRKTGDAREKAESVKRINTVFPHWFCDEFKQFNDQVDRLPFDQHALVALCAPRPVLLTNALDDQWADPDGQFRVLQGAEPVYRLFGKDNLGATSRPEIGVLLDSRLGYYLREGKHSVTAEDWRVFLDYADRQIGRSNTRPK